ncbi:hypothetical protein CEXT_188591 [Caerostris extrusa]|uniref:Transmembrane protein n=1 Tax=Caerostris extrusa TaxID=172846 RepID=A0AAV4X3D2_CAEEX|nr:hypothetical protein CEXT_188591 [Caerostris extrusa]
MTEIPRFPNEFREKNPGVFVLFFTSVRGIKYYLATMQVILFFLPHPFTEISIPRHPLSNPVKALFTARVRSSVGSNDSDSKLMKKGFSLLASSGWVVLLLLIFFSSHSKTNSLFIFFLPGKKGSRRNEISARESSWQS